jgi:uncharacterized protein (DUF433 family)
LTTKICKLQNYFKTQAISIIFVKTIKIMIKTALSDRISVNSNICFGKPCIKGTRIWVSLILDFLASGETINDILDYYPQLKYDDILACLSYNEKK